MGAPRGRNILADLERAQDVIADAPPNEPPSMQTQPAVVVREHETVVEGDGNQKAQAMKLLRAVKRRKEPTLQTNARFPISLLDDIDDLAEVLTMTKTDIMVEGVRREVARLKKLHGIG
ncbi:hypothetical protein [Caballeronia zhejiangensis]|uniref:Uncharacterized protein n=1 Tax=Caballeronia zhejiangensis TaxID=871203 RepID=A0A656QCV8_9BURK|nr:hypothetical protein [Caballeronia zhejiangensis]KDR26005.1 hypothetical protein BG60_26575 [Caballeronia zhejiangensis]